MALFHNRKAKLSLAAVIIGAFLLAVLVFLGAFVNQAIHSAATDRLKYSLPKGYKQNTDLKWCYERKDGEGKFSDEYYMWNLTNLDEVLAGGNAVYRQLGMRER